MNLTLDDLLAAQPALQRLVQHELPATTAFRLGRIARRLNPELQDFGAARKTLLDRFGVLSEDKTQYRVAPENQAEFTREMQALLDVEVELDIVQIAEDDLPDLTAADAMVLWWLVEETKPDDGDDRTDE